MPDTLIVESLVSRFIKQLDALIPFLEMSRKDVFDILNENRAVWFVSKPEALPEAYDVYRIQVSHSAFLLGYSYLENFLYELIELIVKNRPSMLPKKKQLEYSEIVNSADIHEVIDKMIKKQLLELFYKDMGDIIKELREKYKFTIDEDLETALCRASLIRNCIIHNSSRANRLLGRYDGFEENREFEIAAEEVHEYGMKIRALARNMHREAERMLKE